MRTAPEETASQTGTAGVRLWVLGPPRIERDGAPVSMDTRKALALLTYLAMERRLHSRDTLAGLLWPEYDQQHARAALRRTLSTLAHAIGPDVLEAERETLSVRADAPLAVDAVRFLDALASVRAHQHPPDDLCPTCRALLAAAVTWYAGDFLAGFALRDSAPFEDWQFTQGQELRRGLAFALARLTRDGVSHGDYDAALGHAQRWLALDRLNEQAHRYLMRLYAWTGQYAAALRQYRDCQRTLDHELGVAPLETTTRLYEAIKQRRLPRPAAIPTPPAHPGTAPSDATAPDATAPTTPAGALPLIGREREAQTLLSAYRASATAGQLIVIAGEAGIGKTRLAEELLAHVRASGGTALLVRCYADEAALPYAPIAAALRLAVARIDPPSQATPPPATDASPTTASTALPSDLWLAEAARLVPELREAHPQLAPAPALDGVGAQVRFFEGVRQVLFAACGGSVPGVLCFDDVQWVDAASLELLAYLVRRLDDHPVCLLLTWRRAEVAPSSPLRRMLAEAQRAGHGTALHLRRLDRADVSTWVSLALGRQATGDDGAVADRVFAETEGLPYFVGEYVRALANGTLGAASPEWATPGGVHDLLRSRVLAMDDTSQQILSAAAILGRSFTLDLVREVSGRGEDEALLAIERLCAAGLVTELAARDALGPHYDFTHEKLRALVLESMSIARQRLLHARTAAALERGARSGQPSQNDAAMAGLIARHALAGGDPQAAARYFKEAGDRARALYAHADALRHYEQARALGYPDLAALHEAMGDTLLMRASYGPAITNYEAAAAAVPAGERWRVEMKLGRVYARRGEWDIAQRSLASASASLGALTSAHPRDHSIVSAEWSRVARSSGHAAEAQRLAERALSLAEEARDDQALAQAHNLLGMLARDTGDSAGAIAHLRQSLALAERLGEPGARAAALNNLALALGEGGQHAEAIHAAEMALALAVAQGDRHHEAALHNNLADLLHAVGQREAALQHVNQGVAIFAEIGREAGTLQPGIWMLTDW